MLNARRRELLNDGHTVALFAETIIRLEEQRTAQFVGGDFTRNALHARDVPEWARFVDIVVSRDECDHLTFRFLCARSAHERHGEVELVEHKREIDGELRFISEFILPRPWFQ